jgi:hypothetical protein
MQQTFHMEPRSGWGEGVYFLPKWDFTAVVAIHELPVSIDTLWLRLLGKGSAQAKAVQELMALPETQQYRLETLYHLAMLQVSLQIRQNICLMLIFYILVFQFQFQAITDNRFVFENTQLGRFAEYSVYVLPILSLLNSRLFQQSLWKITVNSVISFIVLLWMLGWLLLYWLFGDITLIRQTNTPEGQIIALYERKDSALLPGDGTWYCRYRIRQHRVFPGILRNEARLAKEVCRSRGGSIPPDLQ